MNVTNFANLFHQNIFQQSTSMGQALSQPPATDALKRLSDNMLNVQDQEKDLRKRFDTLELSAADSADYSPLADVPEELLHFCLNLCKVGACGSQQLEASLTEYRDQLSAFDQTIQSYQDMLDGKAALPDQMTQEDVSSLLEAAKAAREQFLQQGAEKLNLCSKESPTPKRYLGNLYSMIEDQNKCGPGDAQWQIDPSAKDIYDEIDRALASARKVTSTFQGGASKILAELKRRGCVQAGEDFTLNDQDPADNGATQCASLFQSIYDELWSTFRQNTRAKQEEPVSLKM